MFSRSPNQDAENLVAKCYHYKDVAKAGHRQGKKADESLQMSYR